MGLKHQSHLLNVHVTQLHAANRLIMPAHARNLKVARDDGWMQVTCSKPRVCDRENRHDLNYKAHRESIGAPRVTQRGIGTLVCRISKQKTGKRVRRYRKNWIYLPSDLVEDNEFPFDPGDRLLISIVNGKKLMLERA